MPAGSHAGTRGRRRWPACYGLRRAAVTATRAVGEGQRRAPTASDDGTKLTLWTRAPLEKQAKLLVAAYNASHKNQVELTVVPNDDYVAKVGAAAGANGLPDLFAADIVYVPNWCQAGPVPGPHRQHQRACPTRTRSTRAT